MTYKPTLLADVVELRNVLSAMDAWESAGGELGTGQGRRSFIDGLAPEATDELAGLALAGLLRTVLAERGRYDEVWMADEPTVRDEARPTPTGLTPSGERGVPAHPAGADAPLRSGGLTYPPRQRSCRVVAAGWLRRRSDPAGPSQPATLAVGAATGSAVPAGR